MQHVPQYVVEGDFDFYKELYGQLGCEGKVQAEGTQETCLITHQPLQDRHVRLPCGHAFNYFPLCQEIANYKSKFMPKERKLNQLCASKIRCPYCRTVCKNIGALEKEGVAPLYGVNSSKRIAMRLFSDDHRRCQHVYPIHIGVDTHSQRCLAETAQDESLCGFHQTWPPEVIRCAAVLKKTGAQCSCAVRQGTQFCGRHQPKVQTVA